MKIFSEEISKPDQSGPRKRRDFSEKSRKALTPRNTPINNKQEDFRKKKANGKTDIAVERLPQENQNLPEQTTVRNRLRNGEKISIEPTFLTSRPPSMLLRLHSRHVTTAGSLLGQPAMRVPIKEKTSPVSKISPEIEENLATDVSSLQISFGRNTALRLEEELENEVESDCSFSSCLASDDGSNHDLLVTKSNKESSFLTCLAVDDTAENLSLAAEMNESEINCTTFGYVSSFSRGGVMLDLSPLFSPSPTKMGAEKNNIRAAAKEEAKEDECVLVPTLSLTSFQECVWLDFGDEKKNCVGKTRLLHFVLSATQDKGLETPGNNTMNVELFHVEVERIPTKKGISLHFYEEGMCADKLSISASISTIDIKQGDSKRCVVCWTPVEAGGIRETIHLKLPRGRLIITVHGRARDIRPRKGDAKKTAQYIGKGREKGVLNKSMESTGRNPFFQAKGDYLTPLPPKKSFLPLQSIISPLKETPKEIQDVVWAETQCDAFAKWMNYTLKPTEESSHENDFHKCAELEGLSDRLALRSLLLHRRQARARRKSQELYNSVAMNSVRFAIKSAVEKGHLAIREDKDMHADLGARDTILELLLSYSTPWLQLGLETVFDEIIDTVPQSLARQKPLQYSNFCQGSDVRIFSIQRKAILRQFLVERVLNDPVLRKKYTAGRCKVPSGVFGKRYSAELRAHSLLHILILVVFLDLCRKENILDSVPRLFTKTASVKSSCALLVNFCRDFMFGEANVIKHLFRLGINVTYKQKLIDEYDFGVTNLASDIRDGIRLARLVEILQGDDARSLSDKMRLPAVSRLQKLHNVDVVLRALYEVSGLSIGSIRAKHIVDAHRDKVLSLLWSIVAHFKLADLLDINILRREILSVLRGFGKKKMRNTSECIGMLENLDNREEHESGSLVSLLLKWCQVVCVQYGFEIHNFSTSFADGKALCYLIHYYHPDILRLGDIRPTFSDLKLHCHPSSIPESGRLQYKYVFENERLNSSLANSCIEELGGIPPMLPVTDSCNIPEEKSVITAVSYIFCRLIESSTEVHAARIIQASFRRFRSVTISEKKVWAARKIMKFWIVRRDVYFSSVQRKYGHSVKVIERFFFAYIEKARNMYKTREITKSRDAAAGLIQGSVRSKFAQWRFEILKFGAKEIQRTWRTHLLQKIYYSSHCCCILLQRFLRSSVYKKNYASIRFSIMCLQRAYRERLEGLNAQRRAQVVQQQPSDFELYCKHASAVLIQQHWRCFNCRIFFLYHLIASVLIQTAFRRTAAMQSYVALRQSVVKVQCEVRSFLVRSTIYHAHVMSSDIQKCWRGFYVRYKLCRICNGVILFQAVFRRWLTTRASRKLIALKKCHIVQSMWRSHQARSNYLSILIGSVIVQSEIRCHLAAKYFLKLRGGVVKFQSCLRGYLMRSAYTDARHLIRHIQGFWRAHHVRSTLSNFSYRIISVQTAFRMKQALKNTLCVKRNEKNEREKVTASTLSIQRIWRGSAARGRYVNAIVGSIIIQSRFRFITVRRDYSGLLIATRKVQSLVRGLLVQIELFTKRSSTVHIQHFWRHYKRRTTEKMLYRSAVVVQTYFLRYQALSSFKRHLSLQVEVIRRKTIYACTIQRMWRGLNARYRYTLFIVGSIIVQSVFRRHLTERVYYAVRQEVVKLQTKVRGLIVRKAVDRAHASSCSIQKLCRGYRARISLSAFLGAVISLQNAMRRRQAVVIAENFKQRQEDTIKLEFHVSNLQRMCRGYLARNNYLMQLVSSIVIQTSFRQYAEVNWFRCVIQSIVCVQSHWRGFLVCKKLNVYDVASLILTRVWRGYTCRISMDLQRRAAVDVQRMWRGTRTQVSFIFVLLSSITIQAWFRRACFCYKYKLSKESAFRLQGLIRLFLKERQHFKICTTVCCLQKFWRMQRQYLLHKKAVVAVHKLQLWLKQQNAISKFLCSKLACVCLQSAARGMIVRSNTKKHKASCKIQQIWRGYLFQVNYILMIMAALQIQTAIRGCKEYSKRLQRSSSAIKIQSWIKKSLVTRRMKRIEEWNFQQQSVLKIQEVFRAALRARKMDGNIRLLQCSFRMLIAKVQFMKARRLASLLQGTLLGSRERVKSSKPVKLAARRIRQATQRAMKEPHMQLGIRTSRALLTLQRSKRMVELMEAVETLETSTRLSKSCCEAFADAGAPEILYNLIRTCNRSLPHVELLQLVLATLENVSSYPKLLPSLATDNSVDILIDLIQMFRDKEVVLWLSAHLLWVILRHSEKLLVSIDGLFKFYSIEINS
jgi:abnormal spindle-like microcephaly-associated protein